MKQRKFNLGSEAIVQFEKREQERREALELRRLQAVRLYGSGTDMAVVQQVSGASRRTIQRWVYNYEATSGRVILSRPTTYFSGRCFCFS